MIALQTEISSRPGWVVEKLTCPRCRVAAVTVYPAHLPAVQCSCLHWVRTGLGQRWAEVAERRN